MHQPPKSQSASGGADSGACIGLADAYLFCPRCGTEVESRGRIPFRCRECGFADYFGPVAAVGAIVVNAKQEMLFVRRSRDPGKGKWGLPGGFVDPDETAEDALRREVAEETGLQVKTLSFLLTLPNRYEHHGVVAPVIDLFFEAQVASPERISLAEDELDAFEWSRPTPKHLDNMAFQSNRLAVEDWMSR